MAATSKGQTKLKVLQFAIEAVKGTQISATHVWSGPVTMQPLTGIMLPRYNRGIPGAHIVEDAFVTGEGTQFNFGDTPFTVEQFAYVLQSLKAAVTSAGTTPFLLDNFAFPTDATAVNDFGTLSFEYSDGIQEWECPYNIFTETTVHGDADADGGLMKFNAVAIGRKRVTDTLTAALVPSVNMSPLNIRAGTVKIDALGTAAGTAAATSNWLLALELKINFGLELDYSVSARTTKDHAGAFQSGNHSVTGKLTCYMDSGSVTQIANARTPTGIVMQLAFPGAGVRSQKFNLPISWTKDPEWSDADRRGFHLVDLEFEAGYSSTSTAQGISMPLNLSASTTLT